MSAHHESALAGGTKSTNTTPGTPAQFAVPVGQIGGGDSSGSGGGGSVAATAVAVANPVDAATPATAAAKATRTSAMGVKVVATATLPTSPGSPGSESGSSVTSPTVVRVGGTRRRRRNRASQAGWTAEEDAILTRVVNQQQGRNWKLIASYLKNRKPEQCLHRWQKVLNPTLTKGLWTPEEDRALKALVEQCVRTHTHTHTH